MLVGDAERPGAGRRHVVGDAEVAVIARRVLEPAACREQVPGGDQVGRRRRKVLVGGDEVGVAEGGDEDLVDVRLQGQCRRGPDGHDAVVPGGGPHSCGGSGRGTRPPAPRPGRNVHRPRIAHRLASIPVQAGGLAREGPATAV